MSVLSNLNFVAENLNNSQELGPVVQELIDYELYQQKVRLDPFVKPICTRCGRLDAPTYYLKRTQGLYELLCHSNNQAGCYSNSARVLCRYVDEDGAPCLQLSEWEITDGLSNQKQSTCCSDHLGLMLGTHPSYWVTPLDKD